MTTVFNPFAMREITRIRALGRRPQIDAVALDRVRRDLFGPVDHEDTRKFVIRELAAQQSLASERWGFDFEQGQPTKDGPSSDRYCWEKVTEDDNVSKAYAHPTISYTALSETITAVAEDADVSAAAPTPPASPLEAASSTCPTTSSPDVETTTAKPTVPVVKSISSNKRTNLRTSMKRRRQDDVHQKKMTDFLRIRKSSSSSFSAPKIRRLSGPVAPSPRSTMS